MRQGFQNELSALGDELAGMCALTSEAMTRVSRALLEVDLSLAEQVITDDTQLNERRDRCEQHACALLVLQAPVAGDLRAVIAAIKVAEKIERMGDLARHIAELVRLRHPQPVVPAELASDFALMGRLAAEASRRIECALADPSGDFLRAQDRADDPIDELQDTIIHRVKTAEPEYPVVVACDVALLTRYFERFADQAVGVAKQLDYAVTGHVPAL